MTARPLRVLLALSLTLLAPVRTQEAERAPNILFLFADDHRPDAVGAHGNPHIATPAIDSLVERGFSFRNTYCMGSHHGAVCRPSRAMLMSGRHLFAIDEDLREGRTLPMALAEAGYQTFGTGKWHNGKGSFERSFEVGANVFLGGMCDHTEVPVHSLREGELAEDGTGPAFSSELFADATIDFLANGRDPDRPFFAYLSFSAPHDPRQPPEPWREHYYEHRPPLPGNFMPLHPFHNGWMTGRDEKLAPWPRPAEMVADQLAEYYGMISHMDEQIGRVLVALEATGEAERTLVVFTADHGLAVGSHGLLGKQSLYEHSTRAPLVVAGPGVPRGESDALVYLLDLVPTLCAVADARPPENSYGVDLGPVLRGEAAAVRERLFTSYEDKMRALREGRWKLIRYPRLDHTQLFDLERDPLELEDLAGVGEHGERVERMLAELARIQVELGDALPLTAETLDPMDFDPSDWPRPPDRWQPQWIRDKYFAE